MGLAPGGFGCELHGLVWARCAAAARARQLQIYTTRFLQEEQTAAREQDLSAASRDALCKVINVIH